jgi:hypothetical protein
MIRLLERTLSTIEAQTSSDFRVIVVCHQIPRLSHTYTHVEFVLVDFPAPTHDFGSLAYDASVDREKEQREKRLEMVKLDKGKKYLR